MEQCKEWVENKDGKPVGFDSHEWVEIENNNSIQILRCEVCKKASSAKKTI
jgi:nitrate reductase alpha subunit